MTDPGTVDMATAFNEACRTLGETIVRERLTVNILTARIAELEAAAAQAVTDHINQRDTASGA